LTIGLRAVPIRKTPNQSRKSAAVQLCWKYVTLQLFQRRGHPRGPRPTGIHSPGSAPLSHLGASINAVLLMHPTPRPIPVSSQFLLFVHMPSVLKMYWVVLTADCRNSVCLPSGASRRSSVAGRSVLNIYFFLH